MTYDDPMEESMVWRLAAVGLILVLGGLGWLNRSWKQRAPAADIATGLTILGLGAILCVVPAMYGEAGPTPNELLRADQEGVSVEGRDLKQAAVAVAKAEPPVTHSHEMRLTGSTGR